MARIVALEDEMKRDEGKLKSITQKWNDRNDDITNMYVSVIPISCHQMDKIFDDKQGAFFRRLTFFFQIQSGVKKYVC